MVQVGTAGVEVAAQYVLAEAQAVAELAMRNPRLTARVEREQVSGGFNCIFAGVRVANAYRCMLFFNEHDMISVRWLESPVSLPAHMLSFALSMLEFSNLTCIVHAKYPACLLQHLKMHNN